MVKISICVPCYNVSKYIEKCLNSLVNQTLKDIEIICVDDGSKDNTFAILKEYAKTHKNITICRHLINRRSLQARKSALAMARGKYVMFVDSDDYLDERACEYLYQEIENESVDIVEFQSHQIDEKGNELATVKDYCILSEKTLEGDEIFQAVAENRIGQMLWNKIYRFDLVNSAYMMSGISDLYYKEDVYLTCLFYRLANKYKGINKKLYYYRLNSGASRKVIMPLDEFKDRCKCAKIPFDWLKCFYQIESLNELEIKLIKSKINLWIKRNTLDALKNSQVVDKNPIDFIDTFIRSWCSAELIDLIQTCPNDKVLHICYYQVRILIDTFPEIIKKFGIVNLQNSEEFKKIKKYFFNEKMFDIGEELEKIL